MKWVVFAALGASLATAGDVLPVIGKALTEGEEADRKATKAAKKWCEKFQDTLDSRGRDSHDVLIRLQGDHKVQESRIDLSRDQKKHAQQEVAALESQLQSGRIYRDKKTKTYKKALRASQDSLETIHTAIAKLPDGSAAESMLHSVEHSYEDQVEDSREQLNDSSLQDLVDGKKGMLKMANERVQKQLTQLAAGLAHSKQLKSQISMFEDHAAMDTPLEQNLQSLCSELTTSAKRRTEARQLIHAATLVVADAANGVSLVRKHRHHAGTSADPNAVTFAMYEETLVKSTQDLQRLNKQSKDVQQDLESMLSDVAASVKTIYGSDAPAEIKTAATTLDSEAKAALAQMPDLFDKVRSATGASETADQQLIISLEQVFAPAPAAAPAAVSAASPAAASYR